MAKKLSNESPDTPEREAPIGAPVDASALAKTEATVATQVAAVVDTATTEPTPPELNETQAADVADAAAADAAAGKAERGEEIEPPDWQKPDYSGPLNIEQAEWRNTRLQRK